MTHGELIRKIKNIEKIEPSQSWVFSNKEFIFNYIQAQERNESRALGIMAPSSSFIEKVNLFVRGFGARFLLPAASALTIIFLTGNFVLAKSQEALPGDALYFVKIFAEKVEVALTLNDEKRATLNFDLADKRLSEISSLAENTGDKNVSGPAVDVAMENFNNHLSAAVSEMSNVVKSDSSAAKAVAVAKIANNKTSDYAKKIAKAKDVIGNKSDSSSVAKDQMAETIKKIEEVNFNALAVLAFLGSEVSQKVGEKISEAMAKTDLVKQKISAMDKISAEENNIKLASDLAKQASDNLDEAKKYLDDNDSSKALEKVVASNDMINTAEKITAASVSVAEAAPTSEISPAASVNPAPSIAPEISPTPTPVISPESSVSPLAPNEVEGSKVEGSPVPSPAVSPLPSASSAPSLKPAASPVPSIVPKISPTSAPAQ